jgi:hypothetical protein
MDQDDEAAASNSSRRRFAQKIVLAGAAAVFGSTSPSATAASEAAEAGEVESRFRRIVQKYGERLSDEQKTRLRKILSYNQKMMEPIRNFPLENGDPTALVLKFYRDPEPRKP